jgi:hypothetical protein
MTEASSLEDTDSPEVVSKGIMGHSEKAIFTTSLTALQDFDKSYHNFAEAIIEA